MDIVHPQRPDRFQAVGEGKLAGHPQAICFLIDEPSQLVIGKLSLRGREDLGNASIVGEVVKALGRAVEDTVDIRPQQRCMTGGQELLPRISPLGPDIVAIIIEDHASPDTASVPSGSIEGRNLHRLQRSSPGPAMAQCHTSGHHASQEFTASCLHGELPPCFDCGALQAQKRF